MRPILTKVSVESATLTSFAPVQDINQKLQLFGIYHGKSMPTISLSGQLMRSLINRQ